MAPVMWDPSTPPYLHLEYKDALGSLRGPYLPNGLKDRKFAWSFIGLPAGDIRAILSIGEEIQKTHWSTITTGDTITFYCEVQLTMRRR